MTERDAQRDTVTATVESPAPQPDPVRVAAVPSSDRRVVLFRGTSEVALLDAALRILDRAPAPRGPTGLAFLAPDRFVVCGELSGRLGVYALTGDHLSREADLSPSGVVAVRDVVYSPRAQRLYALDPFDRRLLELRLDGGERTWSLPAGPDRILLAGDCLVISCVLAHQILVIPVTADGAQLAATVSISHAGPIFGIAASPLRDGIRIAAGGVEDVPLDRTAGEFDNMDSTLFVHELRGRTVTSLPPLNLSAAEVITPRALAFDPKSPDALWVAGAGSRTLARVAITRDGPRIAARRAILPGVRDLLATGTGLALASPLADTIWQLDARLTRTAALELPPHADAVGEYLVFTNMLTPHNASDGPRSRLTCEACHFEGYGDGRVHYTGRGTVRLTPKPIRGLIDNVPLFSRAGDPSLSTMTPAEFRVANQHRLATFDVDLSGWTGTHATLSPDQQREAFLTFLARYRLRPNPQALAAPPSPLALRGLAVFHERCDACHQARTSTREPATFLPPERWADSLAGRALELVWAAPFKAQTGIRPYPSAGGTRVPSLRRIWTKFPYFTDGSSRSLADVLTRFRYRDGRAWHSLPEDEKSAPAPSSLSLDEIDALLAALRWF